MAEIVDDRVRVGAMVRFEVELARSQAELGLIPPDAAEAIAAACERAVDDLDPVGLLAEGWRSGTPVVPLLAAIRAHLPAEHHVWLHHRATTQDVIDSAAMLVATVARSELARLVAVVTGHLTTLTVRIGDRPIVARTLGQPALASTWGQRIETWSHPLFAAGERLAQVALPVQLGGAIGDRVDLPPAVVAGLAARLGLDAPTRSWHTDRTPVTDLVYALGRVVAAADKVAGDLVLLAQPELDGLSMRGGGSSAMAHKQNPIDAIRARAAAHAHRGVASIVLAAPAHEFERAAGAWHAEWFALPLVWQTAAACVEALGDALATADHRAARLTPRRGSSR